MLNETSILECSHVLGDNVKYRVRVNRKCVIYLDTAFFSRLEFPTSPRSPFRFFEVRIRHNTIGRTPPDEWCVRCRDFYLTTHNTHKRQISMILAGFKPEISESELPQTHTLDHAATRIGVASISFSKNIEFVPLLYPPRRRLWSDVSQMLFHQGVDPTSLLRRGVG